MRKYVPIAIICWVCLVVLCACGGGDGSTSNQRLAVTPPAYDNVGEILTSMGKSFSEIPVAELANSKLRDTYDVVFINCADFTKVITPEMLANLRIFVEKGGILYGSDNAGEILAGAFPEQMQLYQDIYQGEKQSLTARVADAGLAKDLGTSELKINFPEGWVPVRLTGTGVSTLVLGDAKLFKTDTPVKDVIMSVSFKKGTGKVVFTGFHFSDLETPALRQNYINSVLF